ncbi:LLM class flavin-dependent oxidoreductase [Streptomyces sp. NPDC051582]|uniref:LLM class flavin-dependent oxidoreductase n=1 Tax=Streptomyces sp. NPDC051582 TaxID=3155167 RepID=UPI0034282FAA
MNASPARQGALPPAGDVSVFFPVMPARPADVTGFAELVRDTSLTRLWMGQSLTLDTNQVFSHLAGQGLRIPVGTAVSVMALRHPYEAAASARSVAALTGESVIAGFGPGGANFVRSLRGSTYQSPLTASREYVLAVREALTGETVRRDGRYHVLHGALPALPFGNPPVHVGLGVLRPGMARLAGEVADAAITWLTPLPYLRDTLLPNLREGARSQDRSMPRVVSLVHFAVDRSDRDVRHLVLAANRMHLSSEHYTSMLRGAGVHADPADVNAGADALVENQVFVTGSAGEIAERIREYFRSGVDEVVLSPSGVLVRHGIEAALVDLRAVLGELEHEHV